MIVSDRVLVLAACLALTTIGCASGRVRGAQGTEMKQAEEYEPKKKVDPPEGNISRWPEAYPVLEVDLERKSEPPPPPLEPEPEPRPEPEPEPQPGNAPD